MVTPLLPQRVPLPGDPQGCPQLLLGPALGRQVGAPALLLNVDDRRAGLARLALFVDLPSDAVTSLAVVGGGQAVSPLWPLLVDVGGGQLAWDGLTSIAGAEAVRVGPLTVSWLEDRGGVQVCVMAARGTATPDELLRPLRQAGVVSAWADAEGHERRWLADNVTRVAPGVEPPAVAPVAELQSGLRMLAGFGTVPAMVSTGAYQPAPRAAAGAVTLARVRTTWQPARLAQARAAVRVGPHWAGPGSLQEVLRSGRLCSLRVRRLAGAPLGSWSSQVELEASVAGQIEVEVDLDRTVPLMPPPALVWDEPQRLLQRLDSEVVATPTGIPVGPVSAASEPVWADPSGRLLDRDDIRAPSILLAGVVEVSGPYGPDRIVVRSSQERDATVALLDELGIRWLQQRWAADAVQVHPLMAEHGW